jgi:hypothetical protein
LSFFGIATDWGVQAGIRPKCRFSLAREAYKLMAMTDVVDPIALAPTPHAQCRIRALALNSGFPRRSAIGRERTAKLP